MNQRRHPHSQGNQNEPNRSQGQKRHRPHDHNRPKHHRGGENRGKQQGRGQDFRRGDQPERRPYEEPVLLKLPPRRFGILFYDTFAQAKADQENMQQRAKEVDQLNIVIKAEGDQNDPELNKVGKVFAGEAWHLIHTRRVAEGWYNEPR